MFIMTTENRYYVRAYVDGAWTNVYRDKKRIVDRATAEDILRKAEEQRLNAVMFELQEDGTVRAVDRTTVGIEL